MQKLIELAQVLSISSHAGQKYGIEDYYNYHIQGVVQTLKLHNLPDNYIIVGYLHDVVEDTNISIETIVNLFGEEVGAAVDAITKREDESKDNYLIRCASNKISKLVKLHDATFNATNCLKNKNKAKFSYYLDTISKLGG